MNVDSAVITAKLKHKAALAESRTNYTNRKKWTKA